MKIKIQFIVIITLAFMTASTFAAPKLTIGAAVGGPNIDYVDVPLIFKNDSSGASVLLFEISINSLQLSLSRITSLPSLTQHNIDFEVLGSGNTARIIITPLSINSVIPDGTLANLRFTLLTNSVIGSQTVAISFNESFSDQAISLTGFALANGLIVDANDNTTDSDGDGITDLYEAANGLHPFDVADASLDNDIDGLTNLAEFQLGTNINNTDSDNDGMGDFYEASIAGLDPAVDDAGNDLDADGLSNLLEYSINTDPSLSDGTPLSNGTSLAGPILTNSVLLANTTYTISDDLEVASGAKLLVAPGAILTFEYGIKMTVNGVLDVRGQDTDRVSFTSISNTYAGWRGLILNSSSTGSILRNTDIKWTTTAINVDGADVTLQKVAISDCQSYGVIMRNVVGGLISNSSVSCYSWTDAITLYSSSPTIEGTTITNNRYGIHIKPESHPIIRNGNIIQNNATGIRVAGAGYQIAKAPRPVVTNNTISNNDWNLYFTNYYNYLPTIVIDATNNWWGTTDIPLISDKIYDFVESPTSPKINFITFLDAQNGAPINGSAISGHLTVDTTWTSDSTFDVFETLIVDPGVTLTVEPNTVLRFYNSDTALQIDGTLLVQSDGINPAIFKSGKSSPTRGSWQGIELNNGSLGNSIDNALIDWAKQGVKFNNADGIVQNSIITNNYVAAIELNGSSPDIFYNTLRNNSVGISLISDSSPLVVGNTITNNSKGVSIYNNSDPVINDGNVISNNVYGIYVWGSRSAVNDPIPTVVGNSILNNTQWNYYAKNYSNASNVNLEATDNWWGTIDLALIVGKIYDNLNNDSYAPLVNFVPYKVTENGATTTGNLMGSLPWDGGDLLQADTTYNVLGGFAIPIGETLVVPSGVTFSFYGYGTLKVNGSLQVQGNATNPVVFTSGEVNPAPSNWKGIKILNGSHNVTIDHAVIEWADVGLFFDNADGELHNSKINNNNVGIRINKNSKPLITNYNEISNNYIGIYAVGSRLAGLDPVPIINMNTIANNTYMNLYTYYFYDPLNVHLNATQNWWGTVDLPSIASKIYDYNDYPAYSPTVDIDMILNAAPVPVP